MRPPLPLRRSHWRRVDERLDPERDFRQITLNTGAREFPWDTLQALSFALFRTYAVPSIGELLDRTGEFTHRVQKRYDDTGLLLEEIQEHGLSHERGRDAVRRINQMHGRHDISNDDMRYVLATFIVMPKRWMQRFGYRPLTRVEAEANVHYYLELGRHMGIKDMPTQLEEWERLLDDYERDHFAFSEGGRRVADSTLELMTTFFPNNLAPTWLMMRFAVAIMEPHLVEAFRFRRPTGFERWFFTGALRLRGRLLRLFPARRELKFARDFGYFRSYPHGYRIDRLGTFP
jgi:hypothetical protein